MLINKNTTKSLTAKSGKILMVFTDTLKQLKQVNNEIISIIEQKEEIITKEALEINELNSQKITNETISNKIESLLS
jgi:hypothetical protein